MPYPFLSGEGFSYLIEKGPRTDADIVTVTVFDDRGWKVASYDADGNETRFVYDEMGRLMREINPWNLVVSYEYDGRGRVIALPVHWKRVS